MGPRRQSTLQLRTMPTGTIRVIRCKDNFHRLDHGERSRHSRETYGYSSYRHRALMVQSSDNSISNHLAIPLRPVQKHQMRKFWGYISEDWQSQLQKKMTNICIYKQYRDLRESGSQVFNDILHLALPPSQPAAKVLANASATGGYKAGTAVDGGTSTWL